MNKYKALFILDSSLNDEDQGKTLDRIKSEVEKLNGEIEGKNVIGKRAFVRPMSKKETGIYVELGLTLDPAQVAPLQVRLKLVEGLFRAQITKKQAKAETEATV